MPAVLAPLGLHMPDDGLGCEYIYPSAPRGSRRGDPLKAPDSDDVHTVLPFVGGDEGPRFGSVTAAIQDEPVLNDFYEQLFHLWR